MTIIYQYRVASTSLGGFLKLLKAWKGSVYKLVYKELLIFLTMYATISLIYRFALTEKQQLFFETIVLDLYNSSSAIPLSFVLGFYVTFIVQRWWQQFTNVPWPDRTLFTMSAYLHGFDDRSRMMRRTVARYMMFGLIWICRAISVAVMKRFPTLDHIVEAGFITKEEKIMFENTECKYQKFFVPLMWANQILVTARRENKIETDFGLRMIIEPLADFRDKCSLCFVYDWITVPLVYTQVVTFAVHTYFAVSLFGQQYLDPAKNYKGFELDFYIPGFTILQFLFYMGWLKVAEQMINPFGEDDDDFDINWLLDRHTAVAFVLVDQCYGRYPTLVKDPFWNDVAPDVPYTESSARSMRPDFLGTTFNITPSPQENEKLLLREHSDVNQHAWLQRQPRKGSIFGSQLSLFPFRNSRQQRDSLNTLESNGSGQGRYVRNGKTYFYVLGKEPDCENRVRWSSVEIPVTDNDSEEVDETFKPRERANTDLDFRGLNKDRKFSLPFTLNLFSKNLQKKKVPVAAGGSPKTVKTPVLSSILETGTTNNLSKNISTSSVCKKADGDEIFNEDIESEDLSSCDEKTNEDDISFFDEAAPCLTTNKPNPSSPVMRVNTSVNNSPITPASTASPSKSTSSVTFKDDEKHRPLLKNKFSNTPNSATTSTKPLASLKSSSTSGATSQKEIVTASTTQSKRTASSSLTSNFVLTSAFKKKKTLWKTRSVTITLRKINPKQKKD